MSRSKNSSSTSDMKRIVLVLLLIPLFLSASAQKGSEWRYYETTLQYVPMVLDLGLGALGAQTSAPVLDRALALGSTAIVVSLSVNALLKNVVKEERPDGSAFNSFPSGHTTLAFAGAELLRRHYGNAWGALGYSMAIGVGIGRVIHNRHWWWDCVAGAGIGIGSAALGSLCVKPIKQLFGLGDSNLTMVPSVDPVSGALCANICWTF